MPVEIRELVVKALQVENGPGGMRNAPPQTAAPPALDDDTKQTLIEDCVRQVLAILEREKER